MKAIVYTKYGPPDVLQIKEVEKPGPKDDEVLIKVHAAEATKADCELRSFNFAVKWFWLPLRVVMGLTRPKNQILGGYFAGEVESVGKDVSKFNQGDQVFGSCQLRMGAYGDYLCLPANYTIVPKPNNMNFAEVVAVPWRANIVARERPHRKCDQGYDRTPESSPNFPSSSRGLQQKSVVGQSRSLPVAPRVSLRCYSPGSYPTPKPLLTCHLYSASTRLHRRNN